MLKKILLGAVGATALVTAMAADVGVSVHVTDPGFYGRVDIGRVPQPPQLIFPQPVIIQHPVRVQQSPIYLHVPPGHAKKWDKHCHKYNACGQPVYFVREDWFQQYYVQSGYHRGDRHDDRHDDRKHKKEKKHKNDG